MAKKEIHEGIRINKFISDSGFCSRRDADQLIADERVTINGAPATLGSRVVEGDKVKVDGEPLHFIPMEMREYKLRRYGSSRRASQEEEEKPKKRVKTKVEARPRREESRRERGEERKRSSSSKVEAPRAKAIGGRAAAKKSSGRTGTPERGKSSAATKSHSSGMRKK